MGLPDKIKEQKGQVAKPQDAKAIDLEELAKEIEKYKQSTLTKYEVSAGGQRREIPSSPAIIFNELQKGNIKLEIKEVHITDTEVWVVARGQRGDIVLEDVVGYNFMDMAKATILAKMRKEFYSAQDPETRKEILNTAYSFLMGNFDAISPDKALELLNEVARRKMFGVRECSTKAKARVALALAGIDYRDEEEKELDKIEIEEVAFDEMQNKRNINVKEVELKEEKEKKEIF